MKGTKKKIIISRFGHYNMTRKRSTFRAKRESHNISLSIEELMPNNSAESRLVLKPRVPGAVPEDSNNPDGLETPKS